MKKIDFKKMMGWLGFVLRCPVCNFPYNLGNTKILDSHQDEEVGHAHMLVHSDCAKCKSSIVFNISIDGPEVVSAAMVTDLTKKDTGELAKQEPISANDILNLHTSLKKMKVDFVKMFGTVEK